jgi:hypothetical protein
MKKYRILKKRNYYYPQKRTVFFFWENFNTQTEGERIYVMVWDSRAAGLIRKSFESVKLLHNKKKEKYAPRDSYGELSFLDEQSAENFLREYKRFKEVKVTKKL